MIETLLACPFMNETQFVTLQLLAKKYKMDNNTVNFNFDLAKYELV